MNIKTIEQELMDKAAAVIKEEIDFELLSDILVSSGWNQITLPRLKNNNHAIDISNWLHGNCKCRYKSFGRHYLFQDKKDAVWFMLRWYE